MKSLLALCVAALTLSFVSTTLTSGQKSLRPETGIMSSATIIADPDVRISYDGPVVHMEAYVAASATNPDLLLAGGELIVPGRELWATEARLYYSTDAGARWNPVLLPNEVSGGWDNAVVGGVGETMYFLTHNFQRGLTVYRTADGGKTWVSTVLENAEWDRPHVVVDVTAGPNRGRLYIAGEARDGVRVMSSADGGQTFGSQITACVRREGWNVATQASPIVLSDGTLVVPCAPYPNYPARATWNTAEVGLVSSTDGGRTFTPYKQILTIHRPLPRDYFTARVRGDVMLSGNFMPGPSFAVAPPRSPFADRLYAAWQDVDSMGRSQLVFAWSADRGANWSAPEPVDLTGVQQQEESNAVRQGVPMLAVNREGVVGVAWFDTRHDAEGKGYDVYFTASLDGGRTLLPSVRISSATSRPAQGLNALPAFRIGKPSAKGERIISMTSPFSTRGTGGDYSTMAVDAAGRFHPLWTDARDGAWQLYTSTVRVIPEKLMEALAETRPVPANEDAKKQCVLDDNQIQLLFGDPRWNSTGSEVVVPVRLLNTSSLIVVEPISVQVSGVTPQGRLSTYAPAAAALVPKLFDPSHAIFSDSATFVYPISARSPLFPNGVTPVLNWRLRVTAPEWMEFTLRATVIGGRCPSAR